MCWRPGRRPRRLQERAPASLRARPLLPPAEAHPEALEPASLGAIGFRRPSCPRSGVFEGHPPSTGQFLQLPNQPQASRQPEPRPCPFPCPRGVRRSQRTGTQLHTWPRLLSRPRQDQWPSSTRTSARPRVTATVSMTTQTHTSTGHGNPRRVVTTEHAPTSVSASTAHGPNGHAVQTPGPKHQRVGALPSRKVRTPAPYLDQEVPRPQPGLPGHPAFVHGLQVLQGREGRRRRELLNGRIRWEGKDGERVTTRWTCPRWQPHPHGALEEDPVPPVGSGWSRPPAPGKGLALPVPGQRQLEQ